MTNYYVLDAEGGELAGPFPNEAMAEQWLAEHPFGDAFIVGTGACDIG